MTNQYRKKYQHYFRFRQRMAKNISLSETWVYNIATDWLTVTTGFEFLIR